MAKETIREEIRNFAERVEALSQNFSPESRSSLLQELKDYAAGLVDGTAEEEEELKWLMDELSVASCG